MDIYNLIERVRKTGKIEKGTNEVTKAIERETAKFVAYASDVEPKEIVQHIPLLCNEKKIPCMEVDNKQKLGISVGIPVAASSVAVIESGDAEADIDSLKQNGGWKYFEKGDWKYGREYFSHGRIRKVSC